MYKTILAQKKTQCREMIYFNGSNQEQIIAFCGDQVAKYNQDGELTIVSPEVTRVLKVGDFIIHGAEGEFYASERASVEKNYDLSGFDDATDIDPIKVYTTPKFVYTTPFSYDTYDDCVQFVADQKLDGVKMYRESLYGPYMISHPTRPAYTISNTDIIVNDGRRLYPCKRDIFLETYDVIGTEVLDPTAEADPCRIFAIGDPTFGNAHHGYMFEAVDHSFFGIHFQEGPRNEPDSEPGVGDLTMIRVLIDRLVSFQTSEYANEYTHRAIMYLMKAAAELNNRYRDRKERGVVGTKEV